ncbi:hypothetical protein [Ohtaekwangia koreensis]|uniref:Phage terminase, small subunit, putative, P27 family n=1 Tax=Ohtaekwangia koreensis TaxID=688867 RepID=A0A1T5JQ91_9BACT|nr:hypothetical protein [Ohtaekwangia koreensis]SKC53566.1 hypothetical protein SAMN05660236_1358 [Ohtaekwangia koreensis]
MDDKQVKNIKSGVIKLLKKKKQYDKETDDMLIDSLIFNLKLIEDSKADILTRGTMVNIGKEVPYYQVNFSVGVFHNAVKSINQILKQLGIEKARASNELEQDPMQAFNEFMNN